MRVTLHVVAGPQTGRVLTFDQHETFMIGRSEDSQFCLPHDRFFSRHHCIVEIAPPQAFLRDLGSTNGTFVNGSRVDTAYLKGGDRIQGGETILEVEVSAEQPTFSTNLGDGHVKTEPSLFSFPDPKCTKISTLSLPDALAPTAPEYRL